MIKWNLDGAANIPWVMEGQDEWLGERKGAVTA